MNSESTELRGTISPKQREVLAPMAPFATSSHLGWSRLEAVRYRDLPSTEIDVPPLTHHTLVLVDRPPEQCELRIDDVDRHVPASAGSISIIPAGSTSRWCWSGRKDSLHVFLEPGLIARVAAESFDLDPSRVEVPPLDRLDLPRLRAAMQAVDAEIAAADAGSSLAAESLANILAVHLIRHLSAPLKDAIDHDGTLPRSRLRAVIDYIEDHLDSGLSLEDLAAEARLSPYHFARQFRTATGLPPHQFVISRRVERARLLMQQGGEISLAQVASRVGFSDQSQFSRHFKRLVGVTPGRFH
jgi:AraC family transcriptional regulator